MPARLARIIRVAATRLGMPKQDLLGNLWEKEPLDVDDQLPRSFSVPFERKANLTFPKALQISRFFDTARSDG